MSKVQDAFIERRAIALAMVHLTRRDDLEIVETRPPSGVDLVVRIRRDGEGSSRIFGVIVKSSASLLTPSAAAALVAKSNRPTAAIGAQSLFPILYFVFVMPTDDAFYSRAAEPVIEQRRGPRLRLPKLVRCPLLDRRSLDAIVAEIDRWYDALLAQLHR